MKNKLYSKEEVTTWLFAKLNSKELSNKEKRYIRSIILLLSSISIEAELNKARVTDLLKLLAKFEANFNAISETINNEFSWVFCLLSIILNNINLKPQLNTKVGIA